MRSVKYEFALHFAQSDQGIRCQNYWILQNVQMDSKGPDETLRMRMMMWIRTFRARSKALFSFDAGLAFALLFWPDRSVAINADLVLLCTAWTCLCILIWDNYSWLSLSRPRLSRITAYLEVKIWSLPIHENLTTDGKYCRKEDKLLLRSNFSSFPQYFQYISNFKSPITYQFVKCG